ncbi:MAG: serine/threonine protein kinase [Candidatus Competibacteraceae bacterium]|nr:serine/threonine protein kinase [Candidatus Competibacteraceae bacterium]
MLVDGKYRLLRPLGQGGMGVVWLVEHIMLKRELALKTLVHSRMSQAVYERFAKEIRTTSQLDHPNLVKVFDCGLLPDGTPYYTMEYASGHSLKQYLDEKGPMPLKQCLEVFVDVAGALSYAHRHNTLHRDIKPDNIVLAKDGERLRAQVLDFGLAKFVHSGLKPVTESTAGDYIGSPPYMSPEQCMGKNLDYRSDVYSLGCTIFQALTGVLPFESKNHLALIQMHLSERPPSLRQAANGEEFPEPVEIIVSRMLAKDPRQRCRSMEEVERLLKLYLRGKFTAGTRSGALPLDNDIADTQSQTNRKSDYSGPILIAATLGIILLGGAGLAYYFLQTPVVKKAEVKSLARPAFATLLSSPPVAGEQFRRFHFPIEIKSGNFVALNSDFKREAQGETEIPADALVIFEPSEEFLKIRPCLPVFVPTTW